MSEAPLDPREQAAAPHAATGFALFSLGFRPFYLLARWPGWDEWPNRTPSTR
jgi:hypothetical protein